MAAVLVFEQNILDFLKDLAYEHKNIEIKIEINISSKFQASIIYCM